MEEPAQAPTMHFYKCHIIPPVLPPCVPAPSPAPPPPPALPQAWRQLSGMNQMEAMRLYVRTVDEEHPSWYTQLSQEEERAAPQPEPEPEGPPVPLSELAQVGARNPSNPTPYTLQTPNPKPNPSNPKPVNREPRLPPTPLPDLARWAPLTLQTQKP